MTNKIKGWMNIALFFGFTASELREALLFQHLPVLVMDGEFYASTNALIDWLEFGANAELGEPQPGRNAFVAHALDRAKIATLEAAGIRIRETA